MEFRDLGTQYKKVEEKMLSSIQKVLNESNFISGKQVSKLEERMAKYVGVKHCISCANGTDALSLVLRAWDIKEGDAVFVPDFTFFATAEVVSLVGATPVFVDVDKDTFNINPIELERKIIQIISEKKLKPKVVIPVDLFGLVADYDEIEKIASKYDLLILEDGAQSFGAERYGRKACSFGHAATTSFFPAKPLGCYGDGGAIFTNDSNLAVLLQSLRVHGKGEDKYDNVRIGVNSRLDTIQAAILDVKLDIFEEHELEDVNNVYKKYNSLLSNYVKIPYIPEGYLSCFAQYTIQLKNKDERDNLKKYLSDNQIPSMIYYTKPMHRQKAFSHLDYKISDFIISDQLCDTVLSLPMHPYLTDVDIYKVSEYVIKFFTI